MIDETAKQTFDEFLETNQVDGSIKHRFEIVRTVNRVDDPNNFFTKVAADLLIDSMSISGRKGKTANINY